MPLGEQKIGENGIYPDAQLAKDYATRVGGLDTQTDVAPCLEAESAGAELDTPVDSLLQSTVEAGYSTSSWTGGERPGHHIVATRQCGRTACGYRCNVTVSAEGRLMGTDTASANLWQSEIQVCVT
jgi:hypothetical protein